MKGWIYQQEDFWEGYEKEYSRMLWGQQVTVYLSYSAAERADVMLPQFEVQVCRCLEWLDARQDMLFEAIHAAGLYALALERLASIPVEEHGGSRFYALAEGLLPYPLSPQGFNQTLCLEGLSAIADDDSAEVLLDSFLGPQPDLFAYQSLEAFVCGQEGVYTLEVNGLAG